MERIQYKFRYLLDKKLKDVILSIVYNIKIQIREIFFKGINKTNKSNIISYKPILEKAEAEKYQIKKLVIKPKLLIPKKDLVVQDIFLPLSRPNKKFITEDTKNKKAHYCATEVLIEKENKNEADYKKLTILPKIKEKRNIYLGMNKFSLNLNPGSAISCGKITSEKNYTKESTDINDNIFHKMKKLPLKEISLNKNKSEKRQRIMQLHRVKITQNFNTIKYINRNLQMNDIVISNDFHGSKILNIKDYLRLNNNKIKKYQQLFKRNINTSKNELGQSKSYKIFKNNNESEKNDTIEISINNNTNANKCILSDNTKRKNFKSFDKINKAKIPKKITETISSTNINNIDNKKTINYQIFLPKKKRNNNDDIINLLDNNNY